MKILTWENLKHCSPPSCADIVVTSLYSIRIRRQFFCGVELERFEWALIGHFFWSGDFNLEENKKIELHIKSQLAVGRTRPEKPARLESDPTFSKKSNWTDMTRSKTDPISDQIASNPTQNQHTINKLILKLVGPNPSITRPDSTRDILEGQTDDSISPTEPDPPTRFVTCNYNIYFKFSMERWRYIFKISTN